VQDTTERQRERERERGTTEGRKEGHDLVTSRPGCEWTRPDHRASAVMALSGVRSRRGRRVFTTYGRQTVAAAAIERPRSDRVAWRGDHTKTVNSPTRSRSRGASVVSAAFPTELPPFSGRRRAKSRKSLPLPLNSGEHRILRKSQYNSIDYVINSSFRKVFDTKSQEVIDVRLGMFNCLPAQQVIALCKRNFLRKFSATENLLCRACTDNAVKEIASLSSVGC